MKEAKEFNEALVQAQIALHKAKKCYDYKSGDDAISLALLKAVGDVFFCLSYVSGKPVECEAAGICSAFIQTVLEVRKGKMNEGKDDAPPPANIDEALADHDAKFHGGEYKEGDPCTLRETLAKECETDLVDPNDAPKDEAGDAKPSEEDVAETPIAVPEAGNIPDEGGNAPLVTVSREIVVTEPDYHARLEEISDLVIEVAKEIAKAVKRGKKPNYKSVYRVNYALWMEVDSLCDVMENYLDTAKNPADKEAAKEWYDLACHLNDSIQEIREMRKLNRYYKPSKVYSIEAIWSEATDAKASKEEGNS